MWELYISLFIFTTQPFLTLSLPFPDFISLFLVRNIFSLVIWKLVSTLPPHLLVLWNKFQHDEKYVLRISHTTQTIHLLGYPLHRKKNVSYLLTKFSPLKDVFILPVVQRQQIASLAVVGHMTCMGAVSQDLTWCRHGNGWEGGWDLFSLLQSLFSVLCRPVTLSLQRPGLQKTHTNSEMPKCLQKKWPIFLTLRTEWIFGKSVFEGECDDSGHNIPPLCEGVAVSGLHLGPSSQCLESLVNRVQSRPSCPSFIVFEYKLC